MGILCNGLFHPSIPCDTNTAGTPEILIHWETNFHTYSKPQEITYRINKLPECIQIQNKPLQSPVFRWLSCLNLPLRRGLQHGLFILKRRDGAATLLYCGNDPGWGALGHLLIFQKSIDRYKLKYDNIYYDSTIHIIHCWLEPEQPDSSAFLIKNLRQLTETAKLRQSQ